MSQLKSSAPSDLPGRSSRITINLSHELHNELRSWAGLEGRSVSNLCLQLIEAAMVQRHRGT